MGKEAPNPRFFLRLHLAWHSNPAQDLTDIRCYREKEPGSEKEAPNKSYPMPARWGGGGGGWWKMLAKIRSGLGWVDRSASRGSLQRTAAGGGRRGEGA